MDSDEKKQACFRQGLSSKLQDRLAMFKFNTFNELVNGAITQEDAHLGHRAEKKRKAMAVESSSSAPQKFLLVQARPQQVSYNSSPMDQIVYGPPQNHDLQQWQGLSTPAPQKKVRKIWVQKNSKDRNSDPCYNCGVHGHLARNYGQMLARKQSKNPMNKNQKKNVVHFNTGWVTCTTLDEVPEGAQVMAGSFLLNNHPVVALFDSGASHSFISKTWVDRHKLAIERKTSYKIH